MANIPGSYNGGVPPNIVWDPENPPIKNSCSNTNMHVTGCDGTCERDGFMTETEVAHLNESREWGRVGMNPGMIMVPSTPFDFEMRINALVDALVEADVLDMEELNDRYLQTRVRRMQKLRLDNEEAAKRAKFGLPGKPPILGPDGQPL